MPMLFTFLYIVIVAIPIAVDIVRSSSTCMEWWNGERGNRQHGYAPSTRTVNGNWCLGLQCHALEIEIACTRFTQWNGMSTRGPIHDWKHNEMNNDFIATIDSFDIGVVSKWKQLKKRLNLNSTYIFINYAYYCWPWFCGAVVYKTILINKATARLFA